MRFGRLPALDGLRGIAVAMVVVFHVYPQALPGGYLGVDLFFVLSGFLITGLLLADVERGGRVDYRRFYGRRVRRLAPAFVAALALVCVITAVVGSNMGQMRLLPAAFAAIFYVGNLVTGLTQTDLGFLQHTWSLAIEEQFYLVWPALLAVLIRRGKPVRWMLAIVGAAALSRAVAAGLWPVDEHLKYLTFFRVDGLMLGAVVAVLWRRGDLAAFRQARVGVASCTAIVALVVAGRDQRFMLLIGYTLISAAGAVLIAHLAAGSPGAVLQWAPLRALGRVSYGVYLYHFPVTIYFFGRGWPDVKRITVTLSVTAVLAAGSWLLIERPILQQRRPAQGLARYRWSSREARAAAESVPSTPS